jgi:hypothetical protein
LDEQATATPEVAIAKKATAASASSTSSKRESAAAQPSSLEKCTLL